MKTYIPTLKFVDHSNNVNYSVYNHSLSKEDVELLGMTVDLLESIWQSFGGTCVRTHANGVSYQMFLEEIDDRRCYQGAKLEYLKAHGVKVATGWALPISKGSEFMDMCK